MFFRGKVKGFFSGNPLANLMRKDDKFADDLVTLDTVVEIVKSSGYVPEPAMADFTKVMEELDEIQLVATFVELQYIPSVVGAQAREAVEGFKVFKVKAVLDHLSKSKVITNTRLLHELGTELATADNSVIFEKLEQFIPERLHDQFKRNELKIDDTVYRGEIVDED